MLKRMEALVSTVLRAGVLMSAALILLGLTLTIVTGDTSCPNGNMELDWLIMGDPFFAPSHILFLGFLTLIATPVLPIMASIYVYMKLKDRAFTTITIIVARARITPLFSLNRMSDNSFHIFWFGSPRVTRARVKCNSSIFENAKTGFILPC